MESAQVPWTSSVTYDDLVKKCPFLSKKSGRELVNQQADTEQLIEPSISKSKKKRLKKRLKALSNSARLSGDNNLEKANCLFETKVESDINPPVSDKVHDTSNLKKIVFQSSAQKDSGKSRLLIETVAEAQLEENNSKLIKKMASNSKNHTPPKKQNNKPPLKERVSDVVDGEILSPPTNLSRGQVLIDREARKKAKQEAKVKKSSGQGESLVKSFDNVKEVNDEFTKNEHNILSIKSLKDEKVSLNCNNVNKISPAAELNDAINSQITKDEIHPQSVKSSGTEKSREDILTEREAKKKAKQLAKGKKNEKQAVSNNGIEISQRIPDSVNQVEAVAAPAKSKAELRAERRAKQEAQRAAKEAEKKIKVESHESNKENRLAEKVKLDLPEKSETKDAKISLPMKAVPQKRIKLFSHLHIRPKFSQAQISQDIHPSIIKLGVKYSSRIINGSNARCVALLNCLKEVIQDYITPEEKEFSRGLESKLAELADYLSQCRPMAVSMTNALRHIKSHLTQLPNNVSDQEAKRKLFDVIDTFIREQIDVAGEAICETLKKKIANGDVILIYSCSSLLYRILVESHRAGREFSVVVVDGGPWFEGREMLRRLVEAGLKCTYVQVSAVSFIMRQATKVLLGAHALLANGCVMSRAGVSLIALVAHSCNVPVLVCCETYKFCERVQTDAFVYNELGSPEEVVGCAKALTDWESLACLTPLSLLYDITPPDLVTAVVTELAILPCTSVPVILRVKPSDLVS